MNVDLFAKENGFEVLCIPAPDKEVSGAYVGDLLSWVMGRAEPGNAWITIMSNANTVAVATLSDISCIILAEGVRLDDEVLELARSKGINVLSTSLSSFEVAVKIRDTV